MRVRNEKREVDENQGKPSKKPMGAVFDSIYSEK
jgi:hypothetical protein